MKLTLIQEEAGRLLRNGTSINYTDGHDLSAIARSACNAYTVYLHTGVVEFDSLFDEDMLDTMFEAACFRHNVTASDGPERLVQMITATENVPFQDLKWQFHPNDVLKGATSPHKSLFLRLAQRIGAALTNRNRSTGLDD
jgi:hypothetical protein